MSDRLAVVKTCKLFIGGAFPRSESGRVLPVLSAADRRATGRRARTTSSASATKSAGGSATKDGGRTRKTAVAADPVPIAYVSHASRKDLRDAVEAATKAQPGWAARDPYNRGQILYRLAEMVEDRREAFASAIRVASGNTAVAARREIDETIDRLISYAGWADKYSQVLGSHDPVSGSFHTFTLPEATGVVVLFPPVEPSLLGVVQMTAAAICTGNAVVVVVPTTGDANPLPAVQLSETCNVSDVPHGVVNVLTGVPTELVPHVSLHRGVDAVSAASSGLSDDDVVALRAGAAENLKRVHIEAADGARWFDADAMSTPWSLEPFVEYKTIWHPSAI